MFDYASIIILMTAIPPKKKELTISIQKEENTSLGCCLTALHFPSHNNHPAPQRHRVFSQPKASKTRKIDLTIGKRGHSQTKKDQDRQRTQSRERFQPLSAEAKKENQHNKVALTIGSKITTQKSSMKTSKVSFNKDMQFQSHPKQQIKSWMTTNNTLKPQQQQPSKQDFTSLPFISQISLVEQQFVSQGSESLQALNFIAQMPSSSKKNISPSYMLPLQLSRISEQKQSRSSMSRMMMEYRKQMNGSGRRRLAL